MLYPEVNSVGHVAVGMMLDLRCAKAGRIDAFSSTVYVGDDGERHWHWQKGDEEQKGNIDWSTEHGREMKITRSGADSSRPEESEGRAHTSAFAFRLTLHIPSSQTRACKRAADSMRTGQCNPGSSTTSMNKYKNKK